MVALPYPKSTVHVHLMPGKMIMRTEGKGARNYTIIVNPDEYGSANGKIFVTDTESQGSIDSGEYE